MLAWLALFLSWGSLGLETATVVVSIQATSILTEKQQLLFRKRTSSTEYRHLCVNECVSARFAKTFVYTEKSSQNSVNVTFYILKGHTSQDAVTYCVLMNEGERNRVCLCML